MPTEQMTEPPGKPTATEAQSAEDRPDHRTSRPASASAQPLGPRRADLRGPRRRRQLRRQPGRAQHHARHRPQPDHRADRALGLRQEHADPLLQPHERPDPGRARSTGRSSTTARTSTAPGVDPVEVRKLIGMVFQKPNPFPKSIYDNIAFGPRVIGMKGDMDAHRRARADGARRCGTRSRTA